MKKLCYMILVFMILALAAGTAESRSGESAAEPVTVTIDVTYDYDAARELAEIMNSYRTSGNAWQYDSKGNRLELGVLNELILDDTLTAAAMQRAAELSVNFAHQRPDGSMCFSISPDIMGENAGVCYMAADDMFTAFAEENEDYSGQGHRRNMLSKGFTHVGIGVVIINGRHYWIMEFSIGEPSHTVDTGATETTADIAIDLDKMQQAIELQLAVDQLQVEPGGQAEPPIVQVLVKDQSTGRVKSSGTTTVSWQSADPSIVSADGNVITGKKPGCTTLTAIAYGKSISLPVEVVPCVHRQTSTDIVSAGNCQVRQTLRVTCQICGETWEEEGDFGSHSPVETIREATCRLEGSYICRCSICKHILEHYTTPKTNHDYGDPVIIQEATTDREGVSRRICLICGNQENTVIPKLMVPDPVPEPTPDPIPEPTPDPTPESTPEPTPVATPTPEPTPEPTPGPTPDPTPESSCVHGRTHEVLVSGELCTDVRVYETRCDECGTVISSRTEAPCDHQLFDAVVGHPTCRCNGYAIERCYQCSYERRYELDMLPHDYQPQEDGTMICSICGGKQEKVKPESGHVHHWSNKQTLAAVSETAWGSYRYYCSGCSAYMIVNVCPGGCDPDLGFSAGSTRIYEE